MHNKKIAGKRQSAETALQETQQKLQQINEQIHYTGQYYATRDVRTEFLKSKNKKLFRADHRKDLDFYDEAVRYFKDNTGGTIPSMKSLRVEKENLLQMISEQKKALSVIRAKQKELQTATANIDTILNEASARKKEKQRSGQEL